MPAGAVRVTGLRQLQKALRDYDKEAAKELRAALRGAGESVRARAQELFAPVNAESAQGFKVRVRLRGVAVEQSKPRTTGQHPEYGALQMKRALLPALGSERDALMEKVDAALDHARARTGF